MIFINQKSKIIIMNRREWIKNTSLASGAIIIPDITGINRFFPDAGETREDGINDDMAKIKSIFESKASAIWLFTGDSITQGVKHTHGQRSYPEIFSERTRWEMGRKPDVVINTAIGGYTSQNLLDDFQQRVVRFQPDVVVLMIGTNDAYISNDMNNINIHQFEKNLIQLINKIREINAVPVLLTPPPVFIDHDNVQSWTHSWKGFEKYVIKIRELSEKNNVILVDNWMIWNTELQEKYHGEALSKLLDDDRVHPNGLGHQEFAIALFNALSIFDANAPSCNNIK
jgi:lysophospholipase L1-like esterase